MASPETDKLRIYEAVMAIVSESTFPTVSYDFSSGGPIGRMVIGDETLAVAPKSVTMGEVNKTYRESRNRRTLTYEPDLWTWQLFLDFSTEVSLEDFENRFNERGLVIPADHQRGLKQINVILLNSPLYHPPQGQPANGTSVVYTLSASVHRK